MFRWADEFRQADLSLPGDHYLWFNDMEWDQPDDLRTFKFASYHKSGFVPFAHAANGDYWCWYPAMEEQGAIPVLLCPHDYSDADLFAPDFASALYHHAVQYAAETGQDDDQRDAMLKRWAVELGPLWPAKWRDQVERLAGGPTAWSECARLVAAELGERYAQPVQIRWMEEA